MKQLLSIFILLLALCCCTTEAERSRMRSGLDSISLCNQNDQPFTVQDVEPYVLFFKDHGTSNDRLLAYYLLGRAYYETGEAPMALECYQKAAECADTTSKDCDYRQLCRVYGQMATLFYHQGLYRKQLVLQEQCSEYAWKAKDTLTALRSDEQKSYAYLQLGFQDSATFIIEQVAVSYKNCNYPAQAATALGGILRTVVNSGDLVKAKRYMDIYESQSKLFDSKGNIKKGREIYYRIKGLLLYGNKRL